MNKENKGITLIALVITIVVLVILVGVSVSVAINTGLIENSKTAVSDYDNAQKAEGQAIEEIAWEINSQANKNALKIYDGVVVVEPKQTLANIKSKLPSGYTIGDDNGTEITDESTIILTGMKILNSNGIVGRVVLLGDVDEDTVVTGLDAQLILEAIAGNGKGAELRELYYMKVVMDVNRDGRIQAKDAKEIEKFETFSITEFPNGGYIW